MARKSSKAPETNYTIEGTGDSLGLANRQLHEKREGLLKKIGVPSLPVVSSFYHASLQLKEGINPNTAPVIQTTLQGDSADNIMKKVASYSPTMYSSTYTVRQSFALADEQLKVVNGEASRPPAGRYESRQESILDRLRR